MSQLSYLAYAKIYAELEDLLEKTYSIDLAHLLLHYLDTFHLGLKWIFSKLHRKVELIQLIEKRTLDWQIVRG